MNLAIAQTLYIYETTKVVIFGKNMNFLHAIFLIVPSSFECLKNGQKYIIVNFVSSFNN